MTGILRHIVALTSGAGIAVPDAAPGGNPIVKTLQSDAGGAYSLLEWSTTGGPMDTSAYPPE
jgi:hypothetical protein